MSTRPNFVDFKSSSQDTMKPSFTSVHGPLSPRSSHFHGDIPPAMSPLDAFAAQSRLLAKQLDDSKANGRRVSRLPPLTIANSLARTTSGFTQSRSEESRRENPGTTVMSKDDGSSGNTPEIEQPTIRPISLHPRLSGLPPAEPESPKGRNSPDRGRLVTPVDDPTLPPPDYFGIPRQSSPDPIWPVSKSGLSEPAMRHSKLNPQRSFDSAGGISNPSRTQSIERSDAKPRDFRSLAPPMSPHVRQAASIRSVPLNSSDEDLSASTGGSSFSQPRKLSSSSGVSMPQSPMPPFVHTHARSPSLNSEFSVGGGSRRGRLPLNFSRPISRAGRPSVEMASRQPSFDSRPSLDSRSRQPSSESQRLLFMDDTVHTPVSMEQEPFRDPTDYQDTPAPSYIYAKYSLPRGRMLQRESRDLEHGVIRRFEWDESPLRSTVTPATPITGTRPLSPETSPKSSSKVSGDQPRAPEHTKIARDPSGGHPFAPSPRPDYQHQESSASLRSGSTIKARSTRPPTSAPDMSAEAHLAKAIQLHENGSLKESTYHLRIAAKESLPTAMLLYALACRHGWGMRPNQQEGVQWLRRAADSASLEIADDENQCKDGAAGGDGLERKTRRAEFALSIYELGVSHMNGWGIEQDKALALRCFEIAGSWGDADAMAEAGFCYAQGTGCKKDLKKAAQYYRMAESKGISMVGNSWYVFPSLFCFGFLPGADQLYRIYKPKYADDSHDRPARSATPLAVEKKTPRDKSRTRTIFGRKKSVGAKT